MGHTLSFEESGEAVYAAMVKVCTYSREDRVKVSSVGENRVKVLVQWSPSNPDTTGAEKKCPY